jgi:threonine dehydratase
VVISFQDIQSAAQRIKGAIQRTPCPQSVPLSEATGCEIYCKLEYLQRTGSFKERGARNALLKLPEDQKRRGVITASAGNHALGLAYHGRLLDIAVTVVMPRIAPLTKITNCQHLGATVLLEGGNIEEARLHAMTFVERKDLTYINGYDHPDIIAGQGTMGLEILDQVPDLDAIVIPIGGAGLIAGVSLALKTLKPSVQVIGVEAERTASYGAAVKAGKPVLIQMLPSLADGLAVPCVGENAFQIAHQFVDRHVLVGERAIALAVLRLVELERAVVEGAGAASLAACLDKLLPELAGKKVVLPLCGGNIDTNILGRIIERGLAADGRLCRFSAVISDRPGGLSQFTALIAAEGASVRDIAHDRAFASEDISTVTVHCLVETRDAEHIRRLRDRLSREGFQVAFPDWAEPPAKG